MSINALKLIALHLMALVLTVGCLINADLHSERAVFLLPAGALAVVAVRALRDYCRQLLEDLQRQLPLS